MKTKIQYKKSEGQHMLISMQIIDQIVEKAKIKHTDTLLEIGAGTGNITCKLLEKSKKVVAFETDKKLVKEIKNKLNNNKTHKNKLQIIEEDALTADWPHFDKMISNIPFNLSLPIILKLLQYNFKSAYILVQKEFADKMFAKPGESNYSRLTVNLKSMFKAEHVMKVKKTCFMPSPKVDTCWVKIEPKTDKPQVNSKEFDNMLKICFGRKNKTLLGNLNTPQFERFLKGTEFEKTPKRFLEDALNFLGFKNERSSKMSIDNFISLYNFFKNQGIVFEYN